MVEDTCMAISRYYDGNKPDNSLGPAVPLKNGQRDTDRAAELAVLENKLADLAAWLEANRAKSGTPEHRQVLRAHSHLNDLILGGRTPEEKASFVQKINELADGPAFRGRER